MRRGHYQIEGTPIQSGAINEDFDNAVSRIETYWNTQRRRMEEAAYAYYDDTDTVRTTYGNYNELRGGQIILTTKEEYDRMARNGVLDPNVIYYILNSDGFTEVKDAEDIEKDIYFID